MRDIIIQESIIIQGYVESYCVAYCLYMIYFFDKGFRIKIAFYNLINQFNCLGMRNEVCNVRTDSVRGMTTFFTDDSGSEDEVDIHLFREKPPVV